MKLTYITPDFAVAPALTEGDFARVAELGFRTVINNRPDGEERGQEDAAALKAYAESSGLTYLHIPARRPDIFTDAVVSATAEALKDAPRPILAFCKSGLRSAIAWAAATARSTPVDDILASLAAAGFDLGSIRDDLESQADRARWNDAPTVVKSESAGATSAQARGCAAA